MVFAITIKCILISSFPWFALSYSNFQERIHGWF